MFGGSVMSARWQVVTHHVADRLRPFPTDITLMRTRDQRQPFGACLAAAFGSNACCIIARHNTALTIGVGAAVARVVDHPVDGRIIGPAPDHVTVLAFCGQIQTVLEEPEQGLPGTAEFGHLVEDERYGLLNSAIGILLDPVANFYKADRGSNNTFAPSGKSMRAFS